MKRFRISCIFIVFFILAGIVGAIDIDNCCILGFEGETYTLIKAVNTTEAICFTVTAPNVTIDCGEFIITSAEVNNESIHNGIYSNKSSTIIKNCDKSIKGQQDQDQKALFDIIAEIAAEPKEPGDDLIVKISLINFGGSKEIDANLEYIILNADGIKIRDYTKSISVNTQTEFLEHIDTSDLKNGEYTLKILLTYAGQKYPASTEKTFYVGLIKGLFSDMSLKTIIMPIMIVFLLFGIYRKSVLNRLNREKDNHDPKSDNVAKNQNDDT